MSLITILYFFLSVGPVQKIQSKSLPPTWLKKCITSPLLCYSLFSELQGRHLFFNVLQYSQSYTVGFGGGEPHSVVRLMIQHADSTWFGTHYLLRVTSTVMQFPFEKIFYATFEEVISYSTWNWVFLIYKTFFLYL